MKCVSRTFKAALDTCYSKLDFYVAANLGSFLLLYVLYTHITEMRIHYIKAAPYSCFANIAIYYAVANLETL